MYRDRDYRDRRRYEDDRHHRDYRDYRDRDRDRDRRRKRRYSDEKRRDRDERKERTESESEAEQVDVQEIGEERMKKITDTIKTDLGALTMPPMRIAMCNALREYIENMIHNEADVKRVKVHVVGSWMSNTALINDPVDLEIVGPKVHGRKILKWCEADTFRDVEYRRRRGRVPARVVKTECEMKSDRMIDTMKFVVTNGGVDGDRVRSTAVILAYCMQSVVASEMIRGLKRWGKATGIIPAALDSYTLSIMVIYFLLMKDEITWLEPADISKKYPPPTEIQYPYLTSKDRDQLLVLFPKFFFFYAYEFNYDTNVISLSLDELLPKSHPRYSTHLYKNRCIHVEDPSHPGSNLTENIDPKLFSSLIEMIHATNQAMADPEPEEEEDEADGV